MFRTEMLFRAGCNAMLGARMYLQSIRFADTVVRVFLLFHAVLLAVLLQFRNNADKLRVRIYENVLIVLFTMLLCSPVMHHILVFLQPFLMKHNLQTIPYFDSYDFVIYVWAAPIVLQIAAFSALYAYALATREKRQKHHNHTTHSMR